MKNGNLTNDNRSQLINEFLLKHGIASIEDAPDELLDKANDEADTMLAGSTMGATITASVQMTEQQMSDRIDVLSDEIDANRRHSHQTCTST